MNPDDLLRFGNATGYSPMNPLNRFVPQTDYSYGSTVYGVPGAGDTSSLGSSLSQFGSPMASGLTPPSQDLVQQVAKTVNPGSEQEAGFWDGFGFKDAISLLGSLGNMFGAYKTYGLMKDQLNFQKEAFQTNLANQKKSYNTALEGQTRSRAAQENRDAGYTDDYLKKHRL